MGFLAPALLTLGIAIAVPLILHLLQRHQGPRVVFPAMRYLRRAERESARRIRLRQILLMALRLALIILLVMAAARPFIDRGGAGHLPTAVAIVLDNSLSSGLITGEDRVLDQLKERALETLERARPDDRFWVIRAGSPWEPAVMSGPGEAAERVRRTEVSAGRADLDAALARARALLTTGAEERATEIHLLTDLQATGFTKVTGADPGARHDRGSPIVLIWSPEGDYPENLGITELRVGGGIPPRVGERSTISVRLTGQGDRDSIPVRLILGDRVVAATTAAPGTDPLLTIPARNGPFITGHVELDPDALRADDQRYFALRLQEPPRVTLRGQPPFISEALDVLAEAGRIERTGGREADVVIAPAGAGLELVTGATTAVVLAPASPTELPATNRRLAEAGIPWQFAPHRGTGEARLDIDGLDDRTLDFLDETRIREFYELKAELDDPGSALLTMRDGEPWAVRGKLPDGGQYILVASPLSTSATTIPTSPALVPLIDRLAGAWSTTPQARTEIYPGSMIELPEGATTIVLPDGTRDPIDASTVYRVPGRAGVYQVIAGDEVIHAFAVNPDPAESDLRRLDDDGLRTALDGWHFERISKTERWADTVYRQRYGREVWRPLILAALAFLLIEGLVAASGLSRRSEGDTPIQTDDLVLQGAPAEGASGSAPDRRTF